MTIHSTIYGMHAIRSQHIVPNYLSYKQRQTMATRRKSQCQGSRKQSLMCSLCLKTHTHLSSPNTWKDPSAKQLLQTYGVHLNDLVCRPCRDDVGCCLKDREYKPRWTKVHKSQHCSIHRCNKQVLANYNPLDIDKLKTTLVLLGYETKNKLKLPIPLCTSHYHQIYDAIQEKQTHCVTCGTSLRCLVEHAQTQHLFKSA